MPKAIPVHIALRTTLRESVGHSLTLNTQLEAVIAIKPVQPGIFHGKVDFSQPPWCAPVANAITDLHALAREMEAWLRLSQGLPKRERGGSSENTKKALENVVRLSEAAQDATVRSHTRELNGWGRRASVALGEMEMPKKLPRQPGEPERACPFCKNHTLRMTPLGLRRDEQIRCMNPVCKDDNGRTPTAQVEYFQGEFILRWMDGVIGLP